MRKVAGAGVLVVLLGGGHVAGWMLENGPARESTVPDRNGHPTTATAAGASVSGAPVAATPAGSGPAAVRASATRGLPPAFRADPLRFLSTAPADSLDLLPGIGPVLAARIVADRNARGPFSHWTDLDRVRGIGPVTIRRLEEAALRP